MLRTVPGTRRALRTVIISCFQACASIESFCNTLYIQGLTNACCHYALFCQVPIFVTLHTYLYIFSDSLKVYILYKASPRFSFCWKKLASLKWGHSGSRQDMGSLHYVQLLYTGFGAPRLLNGWILFSSLKARLDSAICLCFPWLSLLIFTNSSLFWRSGNSGDVQMYLSWQENYFTSFIPAHKRFFILRLTILCDHTSKSV